MRFGLLEMADTLSTCDSLADPEEMPERVITWEALFSLMVTFGKGSSVGGWLSVFSGTV